MKLTYKEKIERLQSLVISDTRIDKRLSDAADEYLKIHSAVEQMFMDRVDIDCIPKGLTTTVDNRGIFTLRLNESKYKNQEISRIVASRDFVKITYVMHKGEVIAREKFISIHNSINGKIKYCEKEDVRDLEKITILIQETVDSYIINKTKSIEKRIGIKTNINWDSYLEL
jgi:hypothetical protein